MQTIETIGHPRGTDYGCTLDVDGVLRQSGAKISRPLGRGVAMLTAMMGSAEGQMVLGQPVVGGATGEPGIGAAFTRNWALCTQAWGASLGGRSLIHDGYIATTADRPAFIANSIVLLKPLEPDAIEDAMAALDDFYGFSRGSHTGRVFLFSVWDTPDLEPYGWLRRRRPPLMHRPADGQTPQTTPGLTVNRVRDTAALRAAEEATVASFGLTDPEVRAADGLFGPTLLDEPLLSLWVGRAGNQVVSTSASFVAHGINNIINVATVPESRGHGYGAGVTWPATVADPALPAVLVASALGKPVYERMGFTTVQPITAWSRTSPA